MRQHCCNGAAATFLPANQTAVRSLTVVCLWLPGWFLSYGLRACLINIRRNLFQFGLGCQGGFYLLGQIFGVERIKARDQNYSRVTIHQHWTRNDNNAVFSRHGGNIIDLRPGHVMVVNEFEE
ncbi:MAG: hypothetical protein ABR955_13065, partial [Verrucomicrobiota bacterium]